jgi:hypothetical protein
MPSLFRVEKHSHADYLPDDIDFVGVAKQGRPFFRGRVRLHQQVVIVDCAPSTQKTASVFEEIDRPFQFAGPPAARDFPPPLID